MRSDGRVTYYFIQHDWQREGKRWAESALDEMLFANMTMEERRSHLDRYRELLKPQSASSDLWQKYGIHGFTELADAEAMFFAVRDRRPEHKFRIVKRLIMQHTEIISEDKYS